MDASTKTVVRNFGHIDQGGPQAGRAYAVSAVSPAHLTMSSEARFASTSVGAQRAFLRAAPLRLSGPRTTSINGYRYTKPDT
jgi:hypothetical protein